MKNKSKKMYCARETKRNEFELHKEHFFFILQLFPEVSRRISFWEKGEEEKNVQLSKNERKSKKSFVDLLFVEEEETNHVCHLFFLLGIYIGRRRIDRRFLFNEKGKI